MAQSEEEYLLLPRAEAALLGEMLHALGQPLTVLGGCRLLSRMPRAAELELLEELADQADRARDLYEALRLLLRGGKDRIAVEQMVKQLQKQVSGQRLTACFEEASQVGEVRVLEGVIWTALHSCAPDGRASVRVREGWLAVDGGVALTAEVPWKLRVAEAVSNQEAEAGDGQIGMVYKLQPFHAKVRLHLA